VEKEQMTVLEKWTRDIMEMEEAARTQQKSLNEYRLKFGEDTKTLTDKVVAQQKSSERYWAKFKDGVEKMKEDSKNFATKFKEDVKKLTMKADAYASGLKKAVEDMAAHIWGIYEAVP